jgi:hypothetical protein
VRPLIARIARTRVSGPVLISAVVAVALIGAVLQPVPVASQVVTLEAGRASTTIPLDDLWAKVWDRVPSRDVPLSAQRVAIPFGGGTVSALTARALHDGQRLYVLVEWADREPNSRLDGGEAFSDSVALQFPASADGSVPPFTMGMPGAPVNIWHWKAAWQADMESDALGPLYPNTYADLYPGRDEPVFRPAVVVGNPVAPVERTSPVENLIAEQFGSLTHANTQDVTGSGEWRNGRWRALFVRDLAPAEPGYARFEIGAETAIAFAVWDGGAGDRGGQKSIAPFIGLSISAAEAKGVRQGEWWAQAIAIGATALMVAFGAYLFTRYRRDGAAE